MAQQWMDGFDHYGGDIANMLDGAWAEIRDDTVELTAPIDGARTGALCMRLGFGPFVGGARRVLPTPVDTLIVSLAFWTEELPPSSFGQIPVALKTNANDNLMQLGVRPDGGLIVKDEAGATVGQTTGPVLAAQTWQHIEVEVFQSATVGTVEVRVDEVVVLNLATLDLGALAIAQYEAFSIPLVQSYYIDDLIVRDDTGTRNNGFEGDLRVATLQPVANGANQGWATRSVEKLDIGVMASITGVANRSFAYADNAVLEVGSGDFCIEGFVRFFAATGDTEQGTLFSKGRKTTNELSWRLTLNGASVGGDLQFVTSALGTEADEVVVHTFPFVPIIHRWYHIAVSREGTDSRMFIDGTQVGTTQTDSRTYFNGAAKLLVNAQQNGTSTVFDDSGLNGYMDGVRFTVGVARYTANFAVPTEALPGDVSGDPLYNSVELLLNFDDVANPDQSSNAFVGQLINAPSVQFHDDSVAYQTIDGLGPSDADFVEAALVPAVGTLTVTDNPLNTETVVVGATTYTFQTTLVDTADNVQIGADAEESLLNLKAAINLEAGAGSKYGTGTVQNVSASAEHIPSLQILATARTPGVAGNSVTTTTTVTGGSWSAATLLGGLDIPTNSEFDVSQLPPEVTGVRSVAIIGRNFKTDSGTSEVTMSFVGSGGGFTDGAGRPVTTVPVYYEDTFDVDPDTAGSLTPSSILGSRIRLDRTL